MTMATLFIMQLILYSVMNETYYLRWSFDIYIIHSFADFAYGILSVITVDCAYQKSVQHSSMSAKSLQNWTNYQHFIHA